MSSVICEAVFLVLRCSDCFADRPIILGGKIYEKMLVFFNCSKNKQDSGNFLIVCVCTMCIYMYVCTYHLAISVRHYGRCSTLSDMISQNLHLTSLRAFQARYKGKQGEKVSTYTCLRCSHLTHGNGCRRRPERNAKNCSHHNCGPGYLTFDLCSCACSCALFGVDCTGAPQRR